MSDPDRTSPPALLIAGRLNSPREFSVSLLCSLLLHAAVAVVLLQDARLPSVETVRDVFLTPDWTEPAILQRPRSAGGSPRELPPRSSPASPRIGSSAAPPAAPKVSEETRVAAEAQPTPSPAPKQAASRIAPQPAAPTRAEIARAPSVAPDAVAPSIPVPTPPAPPPVSAPAPGPVQAPTSVAQVVAKVEDPPRDAQPLLPEPALPPAPPAETAVAPPARPIEAPVSPPAPPPVVASTPAPARPIEAPVTTPAPLAPPVETPPLAPPPPLEAPVVSRAAPAPAIEAPAVPAAPPAPPVETTVASPIALPPQPELPVAPPSPSLGLPAPPEPLPARAAAVPAPPLPSPLDWEVPAAVERNTSSVGRTPDGATGAVAPAAPPSAIATEPPAMSARAQQGGGARADRTAATPRGSVAQPLTGSGTGSPANSAALLRQRSGERSVPGSTGEGTTATPTTAAPTLGAIAGSGVLSAQRSGERVALAAPGGESARTGAAKGAATGTAPAAMAPTTAPTLGQDLAGPPAIGPGGTSGTAAQSTAPTTGPTIASGTPPGEVKAETGVGSGGQAAAEAGAGGEGPRGGGRGPANVAITTPQNGYTLSPDEPPIIVVRGQVDDPEVSSIWLNVNKRRVQVRVQEGRFYYPLVVVDPATTISAELPTSSGRRSEAVTVHADANASTTGVVLIDWGEAKPPGGVDMAVTWRARADRLDGPQKKLSVKTATLPDDIPVSAFYLRNMQAGVYTFMLGYRGLGGGTPFTPRFFLTSPGIPTARDLKTVTVAGTGSMPAVRILLPHAVLWDQDDWFTGRSEASDTMTKFRDDGTSWIERKGVPIR